jgi:hypothetical protein
MKLELYEFENLTFESEEIYHNPLAAKDNLFLL